MLMVLGIFFMLGRVTHAFSLSRVPATKRCDLFRKKPREHTWTISIEQEWDLAQQ